MLPLIKATMDTSSWHLSNKSEVEAVRVTASVFYAVCSSGPITGDWDNNKTDNTTMHAKMLPKHYNVNPLLDNKSLI